MMRVARLVVPLVTVALAGCSEGSFSNKVTLTLTRVDGQALPTTLPSGTGTVQVVSGSLIGSRFAIGCTWVLNLSNGSNPTGDVPDCAVGQAVSMALNLELSGAGGPTGTHNYHFGVPLTAIELSLAQTRSTAGRFPPAP